MHAPSSLAAIGLLAGIRPALAHPGGHALDAAGFLAGVAHPISGIDHAAAMVAVGMLGCVLGGAARWGAPALFLAFMAVGAVLPWVGVPAAVIEAGVLASLVVLGGMLALGFRPAATVALALVAGFALFHGAAHASDATGVAAPLPFAAGVLAGAAAMLAGGTALVRALETRARSFALLRAAGLAIAVLGGALSVA